MKIYFCASPSLWKETCPEWAGQIYPEIVRETLDECRHVFFAFEEFLDERIEIAEIPFEEWEQTAAGRNSEAGFAVDAGVTPDQSIVKERLFIEIKRQMEKIVRIMQITLDGAARLNK